MVSLIRQGHSLRQPKGGLFRLGSGNNDDKERGDESPVITINLSLCQSSDILCQIKLFLWGLKPLENKGVKRMGQGSPDQKGKIFFRQMPAFAGDTHIGGETGDRGKEAHREAHRAGGGERGETISNNQPEHQAALKINQGGASVIRRLQRPRRLGGYLSACLGSSG